MIVKTTGEVKNGFFILGNPHNPIYLLDGKCPILFEAGLTKLFKIYLKEIRSVLGKVQPTMLFLTHSHFDHCGAAFYLKNSFPGISIAASERTADILHRPNAVKLIRQLNIEVSDLIIKLGEENLFEEQFVPCGVDLLLRDGETVSIGNELSVQVFSSPGHTRDLLSYYIPERKLLICAEASGCANSAGTIITDCLADYDSYIASLVKLSTLDVEILCQGHHFVYVGKDAREFIHRSINAAREFMELVINLTEEYKGDFDAVKSYIKGMEYDCLELREQSEKAYLINLEARINSVLKSKHLKQCFDTSIVDNIRGAI
jgi:glyoxylase-like metal-dependent hydrolase (beta-lactamase superfamily II)